MKKTFVAVSALVVGGGLAADAYAQAVAPTASTTVTFTNSIQGSIDSQSTNRINILVAGTVVIKGTVAPDSIGQSLVDGKQLLNDNSITFIVPPGTFMPALSMTFGNFADIRNISTIGDVAGAFAGATGNIGISVATGDNVAQDNAVAISTVQSWNQGIKADIIKLQEAINDIVNWNPELNGGAGGPEPAVVIHNAVEIANGSFANSAGSIGVNVAAGYNIGQQNAMAISVASPRRAPHAKALDVNLASANVGVIQHLKNNTSYITRNTNDVTLGEIGMGAAGNVGINAAGGGNLLQNNALSVGSK